MLKRLFIGGLCGFAAMGCSGPAGQIEEPIASELEPLQATASTGSIYRLNAATFAVLDHSGNRVARVQPASADLTLSIVLKPGNYTVVLLPGWVLQRKVDSGWVDMHASITAQPIAEFWIHPAETLPLRYAFSATYATGAVTNTSPPGFEGDLSPGANGTALISMEVDDCGLYVSKISSLAAFTIDCLGTLNASQYSQVGGALVRNFTACTTGNATALASIDGVLSLQYDRPDLRSSHPKAGRDIDINRAFSAQCISGAWEKWRSSFVASGVNVCPTWQTLSEQNSPATGVGAVVAAGLPAYTTDRRTKIDTVVATTPNLVQMEKFGITYQVAFPAGSPASNCGTAAQCAVACAGGFKGFVLSTNGTTQVTADPAYWESEDVYLTAADNPFLATGYYHAMADYGVAPGDQFGHGQRAMAYKDKRGLWVGESCTYYLEGTRFWTKLIYNKNVTGAVSWCKPPN